MEFIVSNMLFFINLWMAKRLRARRGIEREASWRVNSLKSSLKQFVDPADAALALMAYCGRERSWMFGFQCLEPRLGEQVGIFRIDLAFRLLNFLIGRDGRVVNTVLLVYQAKCVPDGRIWQGKVV